MKPSKNKFLNKKMFIPILLIAAIAAALITGYAIISSSVYEMEILEMHVIVGDFTKSAHSEAGYVNFGFIEPGETEIRIMVLENNESYSEKILIKASGDLEKWISVSKNNFLLERDETKTVLVTLNVPKNAKYGSYNGTLVIESRPVRRSMLFNKISGLVAGVVTVTVKGQGNISVIVNDSEGNALEDVDIKILSNSLTYDSGTTNSSGEFTSIQIFTGNYTVNASKTGYSSEVASVEVLQNTTSNVSITLSEIAALVEAPVAGGVAEGITEYGLNLSIFPSEIKTYPGETKTHTIVVENIGTFLLHNLKLSISGSPYDEEMFEITPSSVDVISSNTRKTFLLTVRTPIYLVTGEFALVLRATTEEIFDIEEVTLIVGEIPKPALRFSLMLEIAALKKSIKEILSEAEFVSSRGGDVSEIISLLELSNELLDKAIEFDRVGDLQNVRVNIELARDNIKKAVELLARLNVPGIGILQVLIFITIISLALALTAAFQLRRIKTRKKRTLKKTRLWNSKPQPTIGP